MTDIYTQIKNTLSQPKISSWSEISGWFCFNKAYDKAVAEAQNGAVFIEIGTFLGRSTAYLATAIKNSGKQITVYAIDPFKADLLDDPKIAEVLPSTKFAEKGDFFHLFNKCMTDLQIDHIVKPLRMTSNEAFKVLNHVKADFISVDGLHTHPYVDDDIENFTTLLKHNGTIIGDDYLAPDVTAAVKKHFGKDNYFVSDGNWPYWSNRPI